MLAITITAITATTIKTISGFESSLFEAGFTEATKGAGEAAKVNVATCAPHLWQKRAFSPS